jgi:signal transduction histidine kinase
VAAHDIRAHADLRALRKILEQVLCNALVHGKGTTVDVAVAQGPEFATVEVTDTGPGFANDMLDRIGAPFTQIDCALSRKQGGLGLGLTLARGLAKLQGGDLTFANRQGGGAIVTLTLPLSTPAENTKIKTFPDRNPVAIDQNDHAKTRRIA